VAQISPSLPSLEFAYRSSALSFEHLRKVEDVTIPKLALSAAHSRKTSEDSTTLIRLASGESNILSEKLTGLAHKNTDNSDVTPTTGNTATRLSEESSCPDDTLKECASRQTANDDGALVVLGDEDAPMPDMENSLAADAQALSDADTELETPAETSLDENEVLVPVATIEETIENIIEEVTEVVTQEVTEEEVHNHVLVDEPTEQSYAQVEEPIHEAVESLNQAEHTLDQVLSHDEPQAVTSTTEVVPEAPVSTAEDTPSEPAADSHKSFQSTNEASSPVISCFTQTEVEISKDASSNTSVDLEYDQLHAQNISDGGCDTSMQFMKLVTNATTRDMVLGYLDNLNSSTQSPAPVLTESKAMTDHDDVVNKSDKCASSLETSTEATRYLARNSKTESDMYLARTSKTEDDMFQCDASNILTPDDRHLVSDLSYRDVVDVYHLDAVSVNHVVRDHEYIDAVRPGFLPIRYILTTQQLKERRKEKELQKLQGTEQKTEEKALQNSIEETAQKSAEEAAQKTEEEAAQKAAEEAATKKADGAAQKAAEEESAKKAIEEPKNKADTAIEALFTTGVTSVEIGGTTFYNQKPQPKISPFPAVQTALISRPEEDPAIVSFSRALKVISIAALETQFSFRSKTDPAPLFLTRAPKAFFIAKAEANKAEADLKARLHISPQADAATVSMSVAPVASALLLEAAPVIEAVPVVVSISVVSTPVVAASIIQSQAPLNTPKGSKPTKVNKLTGPRVHATMSKKEKRQMKKMEKTCSNGATTTAQ
jgi:hypothetical protein